MYLADLPSLLSISLWIGPVVVGLASWLGGDETETEEDGDEFEMDDDFGGMDDLDDDFGGMEDGDGGGTTSTTELENRIEDLESEIADVSSTANTVRSENEQISEKVDDVEENVRKLLEIYEMVTKGVNPFVDDVDPGAGVGDGGENFGLFEGETADDGEEDEDLDEDIADAEAEDFFDDDAFDDFDEGMDDDPEMDDDLGMDDAESFEDFDEGDGGGEDAFAMEEETADEGAMGAELEDDEGDGDDGGGGGTSFEELKEEYESGEADWADDLDEDDEAAVDPDDEDSPEGDESSGDLFMEDDLTADDDGTAADQSHGEGVAAAEEMAETEAGQGDVGDLSADRPAQDDASASAENDETAQFEFGATAAADESPHLERPPDGYLADVVMLEWLDFLVSRYDARTAVRAINYYERIGWIGDPMREHLIEMMTGITDAEYVYRDEFGTTDVTMSDHRRSLRYVEQLAGGSLERAFADRLDERDAHGI